MSNVFKSLYIQAEYNNPRIIDSDARMTPASPGEEYQEDWMEDAEYANDGEIEENVAEDEQYISRAQEIIDEATRQSEEIINEAKKQAEALKNHAMSEGKKQGYDEGYNLGYNEGLKKAQELEVDIEARKRELELEYQEMIEEIEPRLVAVIAEVYEKVFKIQFGDKKEIIFNVIKNSINRIENSKEFLIKVPGENLQFIMEHKDELQEMVGNYVKIEIIADNSLSNNQCLIHTDSGVFDCSLDIQLDNLVRDIKTLSIEGTNAE